MDFRVQKLLQRVEGITDDVIFEIGEKEMAVVHLNLEPGKKRNLQLFP